MKKKTSDPFKLFINRELSWLAFNDRVLQQGQNKDLPLAERLKFLAIVSSNLDEFFMIRVAGLRQQHEAGLRRRDPSGLTPGQQLLAIHGKVHTMVAEQTRAIQAVFGLFQKHQVTLTRRDTWSPKQHEFLYRYFNTDILPILTPLAVEALDPCPLLPGLQLFVAALVKLNNKKEEKRQLVMIPVPAAVPRFVTVPMVNQTCITTLEEIILDNLHQLFPGQTIEQTAVLRLTRDADVAIQEDEAGDLLSQVEDAVVSRRRRAAVRLEISVQAHERIRRWLVETFQLRNEDIYEIDGLLDAKALWQLVDLPAMRTLQEPSWPPQPIRDLLDSEDLWSTIQSKDILLSHPFESFQPVIQLVEQAAEDPDVMAIKQTLYRVSGDSPIVHALERAAENNKEVVVLVELKARFDEANNIRWARRLEDAGCHVIYGIAGHKTHSKALLIVRREGQRIRRYVHLGTGNYNDKTARLYADLGLLTCDETLCRDVAAFFNLLTGISEVVGWHDLTIAPTDLRRKILDLIERETEVSTPEYPGLIRAKMNSLQDPEICQALYRASQAGVRIQLHVRGICCLRPHLKGVSDNIEVTAMVDRYLEHARIFTFANGGHEEIYLSSADWMRRNLDKRFELFFPIKSRRLRQRIAKMLDTYFADNTNTWVLHPDGQYERIERSGKKIRAQERLYKEAVAVIAKAPAKRRFKPLKRPK
jgi:polyphosphate kinase